MGEPPRRAGESVTFGAVAGNAPASSFRNAQPRGSVPKRNYGFEKRQKELAKMQKRQLKAERRAERAQPQPEEQAGDSDAPLPPDPGE